MIIMLHSYLCSALNVKFPKACHCDPAWFGENCPAAQCCPVLPSVPDVASKLCPEVTSPAAVSILAPFPARGSQTLSYCRGDSCGENMLIENDG